MQLTDDQRDLLALCRIKGVNWYVAAREAQRPGGLARLLAGQTTETTPEAIRAARLIATAAPRLDDLRREAQEAADSADRVGAVLLTVLDQGYPTNLRLIFNLPPFLFVRGELTEADLRSVAVVGTRKPTEEGIRRAGRMARLLAERGVTVVSGLAAGIDTAAHVAALDAGARTIAVVGTGVLRTYPRQNQDLAENIVDRGAIVSQFWPDAPPATYTFPRRNVTMSGIAQGTVVVEASHTSGAKMQARLALEHGKKVFLLRSLVDNYAWAERYASERGALVVDDVDDVIRQLVEPGRVRSADNRRVQLALEFA